MIFTQAISPAPPARKQVAAQDTQDTSDEALVARIAGRDKQALQLLYPAITFASIGSPALPQR